MLILLLLAAGTAKTQGAYDEVRETDDGKVVVMRTFDWEIEGERAERATVHWLLQEDGSMRYDFDRQPAATQDAHRRSCALQGMQPSRGVGMISGEGTLHGFSCTDLR
ncbi:hypothetical protein [Stenotrophomonas sp. G106K1]|uniref:hypothetical protein n=1 Tax=Stenotrophomonas sp. G106K1 TaxID=3134792 RepID=UPI0030F4838A